jgi:hypothetical protein
MEVGVRGFPPFPQTETERMEYGIDQEVSVCPKTNQKCTEIGQCAQKLYVLRKYKTVAPLFVNTFFK